MNRTDRLVTFVFFSLIVFCFTFADHSHAQESSFINSAAFESKSKKQFDEKLVPVQMNFLGVSASMNALAANEFGSDAISANESKAGGKNETVSVVTKSAESHGATFSFLENENLAASTLTAETSFEGPGLGMNGFDVTAAAPDAALAVGPNHVVTWVNFHYAIFDKTGNKLLPGNGFVAGNSLFASLGTNDLCASTNRGKPIVQYDRLANRWIFSQYAFADGGAAPYLQCFAISTTADPTGQYYLYSFSLPGNGFNDYGKLGVWTDAYYVSYIVYSDSTGNGARLGTALCAYDKAKMMAGQAATSLCGVGSYAGVDAFLPADFDGSTVPADTSQGGVFAGYSASAQAIRLIKLKPDFDNLTGSLDDGFGGGFGSFVNLPVGATTLACNGTGKICIAQPATTTLLDSIGDRLMPRLAYRNRGGTESLLVNQSVDPDAAGAQNSAVRWYEIRNPFGNPADANTTKRPFFYQNATFNPTSGDRWLGSLASDRYGNILLGYSVANAAANLKPSIAVAGRLQNDPLNTLQSETVVQTGTGSQTGQSNWGAASTMQIDPANDTTFWYINQYLATDGALKWRTKISSFRFLSGIGGTVAYGTGAGKVVPNVIVTVTGDSSSAASTDAMGAYNLNLSTGGNYIVALSKFGNANGITAFDSTLVLRHVAANGQGSSALTGNQLLAADANGDGTVTAFDATLILRYAAANASTANTGQVGNWRFTPASKSYPQLLTSSTTENYTAILIGEVNGSWTP